TKAGPRDSGRCFTIYPSPRRLCEFKAKRGAAKGSSAALLRQLLPYRSSATGTISIGKRPFNCHENLRNCGRSDRTSFSKPPGEITSLLQLPRISDSRHQVYPRKSLCHFGCSGGSIQTASGA